MNPKKTIRPEHKKQHAKNTIRSIKRHWQLYLIVALPLVYLIVFKYMPIIGSQIAFRDYNFKGGIWHSPFVGLKYFKMFFQSPQFWRLMGNTLGFVCVYFVGGHCFSGTCEKELLYYLVSCLVYDGCMFYLYLHCSRRIGTF